MPAHGPPPAHADHSLDLPHPNAGRSPGYPLTRVSQTADLATGTETAKAEVLHIECDGDVDLQDFAGFQRVISNHRQSPWYERSP